MEVKRQLCDDPVIISPSLRNRVAPAPHGWRPQVSRLSSNFHPSTTCRSTHAFPLVSSFSPLYPSRPYRFLPLFTAPPFPQSPSHFLASASFSLQIPVIAHINVNIAVTSSLEGWLLTCSDVSTHPSLSVFQRPPFKTCQQMSCCRKTGNYHRA